MTYSATLQKLATDDMETFIKDQLDRVALTHTTFMPEAMGLIPRSAKGAMRSAKNLCIEALLEAVRDKTRTHLHGGTSETAPRLVVVVYLAFEAGA